MVRRENGVDVTLQMVRELASCTDPFTLCWLDISWLLAPASSVSGFELTQIIFQEKKA